MITELDVKNKLLAAMACADIIPTEDIILDGEIHRFHITGDNPTKYNGWAVVNIGVHTHAYFGSWRTGKKHFWQLTEPTTYAELEAAREMQAAMRAKQQAEQKEKHQQAADTAHQLLEQAEPAEPDHPYLAAKQIQPNGILQLEGVLLVPMYDGIVLTSLQCIYRDGSKRFLRGGRIKGCYYRMGEWSDNIKICEGFATACTLRQEYGSTIIVGFTAGNLSSVAGTARHERPSADITIAADNDQWTEGNPGLTKARNAAALIRGKVIYPNFKGMDLSCKPSDFNDYVNLGGVL